MAIVNVEACSGSVHVGSARVLSEIAHRAQHPALLRALKENVINRIAVGAISALALLAPMIATPSYAGGMGPVRQNGAQLPDTRGGERDNGPRNEARRGDSDRGDRNAGGQFNNDRQSNRDRGDGRYSGDQRGNDWRGNDDRRDGRDYSRAENARDWGRRDNDRRDWRRGDRLPSYYRSHYREVNYRDHGWRAPPRGYHYVRDDRGDALLVGIATGAILGVILAGQ